MSVAAPSRYIPHGGHIMKGFAVHSSFEQTRSDDGGEIKTMQSAATASDRRGRIGIMCTVGPLRFTPFLSAFRLDYPSARLTIVEGAPRQLAALLADGRIEAAVLAQPLPFGEQFNVHALYAERFTVAVPPGHRLAARRRVALGDLHEQDYVERVHCEYGPFIDELMSKQGVCVRVVHESEREDWVQMMVMSGAGAACLPEYSPLLPGLPLRPLAEPEIVRIVSLVASKDRELSPAAAAFALSARSYKWRI